ncbi:MAG: hypothetical protein GTN69_10565 [Armatimonadetes bacterium]|nr:hypothetical protein [Armatimonadota bacterium]
MPKRSSYEDGLQRAVIQFLDMRGWRSFHVPNGMRAGGKNPQKTAAIMRGLGLKKGVPDVIVCEPWQCPPDTTNRLEYLRYEYAHGMGIAMELKAPGKYPTPEQREWLIALAKRGWYPAVCRTIHEATALLERIVRPLR